MTRRSECRMFAAVKTTCRKLIRGPKEKSVRKKLKSIMMMQTVIFTLFFLLSLAGQIIQSYRNNERNNFQTAALMAQDTVNKIKTSMEITKFPITPIYENHISVFDSLKKGSPSIDLRYCQELSKILRTYLSQNRFIDNICVYEMDGAGVYVKIYKDSYYFCKLQMDIPWVADTLSNRGEHTFVKQKDFINTGLPNPSNDLFCVSRAIIDGITLKRIGIVAVSIPESAFNSSFATTKNYREQEYALLYRKNWLLGSFSDSLEPQIIESLEQHQQKTGSTYVNGMMYMYNYYRYDRDWTIVIRTPISIFTKDLLQVNIPFFLGIAIMLLVIVLIINHIIESILHPLNTLVETCDRIEERNFPTAPENNLPLELKHLFSSFNAMSNRVDVLVNEVLVKDLSKREIELQLLRTQINPHFLYNTLECMHMRAYSNRDYDVSTMSELLGKNLRYGLRDTNQEVPLSIELEQTMEYIRLISYYYADQVNVNFYISDDILNCMTIKLILQPLIENACIHGMLPDKQLNIDIMGCRVGDGIELAISDDGAGIAPEKLADIHKTLADSRDSCNVIGLRNVHRRLQLYYGQQYGIMLKSIKGQGTMINIRIPFAHEGGNMYAVSYADHR